MATGRHHPRRQASRDQLCVVVRVDVVIYVLIGVIAVLALASVAWPGRVELSLVTGLGTLLAGILTGWLTYMRLSRRPPDAGEEQAEAGGREERQE